MGEGHCSSLASAMRKWFPWFLRIGIMGFVMFAGVTSADQIEAPSTSELCISDCATCPVICSPPPPLLKSFPPPSPSVHHSSPPPPPLLKPFPPPSRAVTPPEAAPYTSWGSPPPPPPPFKYYNNMPPSGPVTPMPPNGVPRDYPYPYYYFYASHAPSLSLDASFVFMLLFLFHFVLSCWWVKQDNKLFSGKLWSLKEPMYPDCSYIFQFICFLFCFVYHSTYVYRYKHLIFCWMSTMYLFDLYNFVHYEKIKGNHIYLRDMLETSTHGHGLWLERINLLICCEFLWCMKLQSQ